MTDAAGRARARRPLRRRRPGPAGGRGGRTSRSTPARSSASPASPATASRSWSRCCPASAQPTGGRIFVNGQPFEPTRDHMDRFKVVRPAGGAAAQRRGAAHDGRREHRLPHLRQAADHLARLVAVARADARAGPRADRRATASRRRRPRTPIANLSGGNVQRAVLARELSGDGRRADRRQSLLRARLRRRSPRSARRSWSSATAAPRCCWSREDLDEILELADRIAVMSGGTIDYVDAGRRGRPHHRSATHMAGH